MINEFKTRINDVGLASANKFSVQITMPAAIPNTPEVLNLMCESATIAGKTVQTSPRKIYGLSNEVAFNSPTYDALTLTFLCSDDMYEKKTLDAWNSYIVTPSGYSGAGTTRYLDEYKGSIVVHTKNKQLNDTTLSMEYFDCFPKTINSMEMNHTTVNAPLKLTVIFSYAYYQLI